MTAVRVWLASDLKQRARSLVVLALLVTLSTATVTTAVAGARRGDSVVERLLDDTLPATIAVLPNDPHFDWEPIRELPGVEALARFAVTDYALEATSPDIEVSFPWADDEIMRTIERPIVLDGRLADTDRADEVTVTQGFVDTSGRGVGDTVVLRLYSPEQIDDEFADLSEPGGPRIEARIVGVVRSPWFSDSSGGGAVIPSPALYREHTPNLVGDLPSRSVNALVRLDGGGAAVPAFRERLAEVTGRPDIELMNLEEDAAHFDDVVGFEANSLLAFALAAAVAAIFLVGQSVTRYAAAATAEHHVLRTLGMTPRQRQVAAAAGPTLAAIGGALLGVVVAVVASSRFPIGSAEPYEPAPGRQIDATVLIVALVAVPLAVAVGAVAAAWLSARAARRGDRQRSSVMTGAVSRAGAPIAVTTGTSFALESGRGSRSVPVRPALLGATVGVFGVVAALTFAAGIGDAASHPERFGQVFQLEGFFGFNDEDFAPTDDILAVVTDLPDIAAVNDSRQAVADIAREVDGTAGESRDAPLYAFDPIGQPLDVVLTHGRMPTRAGEVALAPSTADDLGVEVGDAVRLAGTDGETTAAVTGIAFVPSGAHNDYDEGAWATRDTYDDLFAGFKFHLAHLTVRDGADPEAVSAEIDEALAPLLGAEVANDVFMVSPEPSRLADLRRIRTLPLFLASFLAVLAVGAVGHTLATAVRRRRHDIAVLRALGVTRWQSRAMVVTQATVLALFGLVVGTAPGVAFGRLLWRSVADSTPVDYVAPLAVWMLVLLTPIALLLANVLAAWPSQRAASIRVGAALRVD